MGSDDGSSIKTFVGLAFASLIMGFALGHVYASSHGGNEAVSTLILGGGAAFMGGLFAAFATSKSQLRLIFVGVGALGLGFMAQGFSVMM